ncbi:uncharacterized protein LOC113364096 [Ctenocephalides felis]|uniref:uncharacterized protein LOC113364096 n=1 Tax=Ctenocephalides felis TaxID=7515 RepID=UPI000E6E2363|nr:uncharacterized protein LOC113364096 [Ctenocephalides felis]XP_026462350.1 uncharacterized protein LOC113364096 [Ctenocephalides felis]
MDKNNHEDHERLKSTQLGNRKKQNLKLSENLHKDLPDSSEIKVNSENLEEIWQSPTLDYNFCAEIEEDKSKIDGDVADFSSPGLGNQYSGVDSSLGLSTSSKISVNLDETAIGLSAIGEESTSADTRSQDEVFFSLGSSLASSTPNKVTQDISRTPKSAHGFTQNLYCANLDTAGIPIKFSPGVSRQPTDFQSNIDLLSEDYPHPGVSTKFSPTKPQEFGKVETYLDSGVDQEAGSGAKSEEVQGWIEILSEDYCKECYGEYPDFLYHIARNKYGALYFRVIRNLLLNKGKGGDGR